MIAKITPLLPLPSTMDVFDYFVPPQLEPDIRIGQMVSVPWRSEQVEGVILSLSEDASSRFRARPIRKIISPTPVLTSAQLKLINKFSEHYFCAPGSVARLMVPEFIGRAVKSAPPPASSSLIDFKIEKSQLASLNQAAAGISPQVQELEIKDVSSFIWFVFWLYGQQRHSSLVLLFPTLSWLKSVAAVLGKKFGQLVVLHSGLSRGSYWCAYQKILAQEAPIVLSTRSGVFLPFPEGSCLVMFDAGSDDFKQYDQHPRYDARTVARWSAEFSASRLIYAAPTFALWPRANPVQLPPSSRAQTRLRLIDMKPSLASKGFSIISDSAFEAIDQAKSQKKKVVIISLREEGEDKVSAERIKDILTKEEKYVKNDSSVIVGTPQLLESGELSAWRGKISSLIIASIEPLLALPDYRSQERAFYRLKHWQMLCQELLIPQILLQAYNTDILAVRAFALGEEKEFIKSELDFRQELGYPPFVELVKVSYKGGEQSEWNRVREELESLGPKLRILGPYAEHRSKRKSLLLKLRDNIDIPFLRSLPSSQWVVDRDPENVL